MWKGINKNARISLPKKKKTEVVGTVMSSYKESPYKE